MRLPLHHTLINSLHLPFLLSGQVKGFISLVLHYYLLITMNDDFQDMADTAENYYQQCDTWRDRSDALGDELDGVFE